MISSDRYQNMAYGKCGSSGLYLSKFAIGLWNSFGGTSSYEKGREILLTAFNEGITHIDGANNYGPPPGTAEEFLGKILKQDLKGYRDELIITTKAGYEMWSGPYGNWGSRKSLMASLDQSLKRMNLDYVDKLEDSCFYMKDGQVIPISRNFYKQSKNAYYYYRLK